MEVVGLELQKQAVGSPINSERYNLFGRSAFNRYYYSLYLTVRKLLAHCDPAWERVGHRQIPELLRGQMTAYLKKQRKLFMKLSDPESISICNKALGALQEMAKTMDLGYTTRVTADYNPEILVVPSGR